MKETNRRTFLKLGATVAVSVVAKELSIPVEILVNSVVEETTGHPTGNSYTSGVLEEKCEGIDNTEECMQSNNLPLYIKIQSVTTAPLAEETVFRAIPSAAVSATLGKEDVVSDVLSGTGGLKMTRRELLVGAVSSIAFGAVHNLTDNGRFDTNKIPAGITASGFTYWYLQRKFGLAASVAAHTWHNFRAVFYSRPYN